MAKRKPSGWQKNGNLMGLLSTGKIRPSNDKDGLTVEQRRRIEDIKEQINSGEKFNRDIFE